MKIHITREGDARPCFAEKGNCPFGGESDHYPNAQVAREAYEEKMANIGNALKSITSQEQRELDELEAKIYKDHTDLPDDWRISKSRYSLELSSITPTLGLAPTGPNGSPLKLLDGNPRTEEKDGLWVVTSAEIAISGPFSTVKDVKDYFAQYRKDASEGKLPGTGVTPDMWDGAPPSRKRSPRTTKPHSSQKTRSSSSLPVRKTKKGEYIWFNTEEKAKATRKELDSQGYDVSKLPKEDYSKKYFISRSATSFSKRIERGFATKAQLDKYMKDWNRYDHLHDSIEVIDRDTILNQAGRKLIP